MVYIGEAETVLKRLTQHLNQKDFWTESIVFISKDENLNKAHIKYLENRLFELAKTVNRYQIDNNTIPTQSSIAESDRAEMEEFIENIKILINTLGHKVFEEKREIKSPQQQAKETFYIKAAFFNYFQFSLGFRDGHEEIPCNEQQIILLNLDEIKTKIDLLKSMTETRIKELLESGSHDMNLD